MTSEAIKAALCEASLERIKAMAKPGQTLNLRQAIDLICDIYTDAKSTLDGEKDFWEPK